MLSGIKAIGRMRCKAHKNGCFRGKTSGEPEPHTKQQACNLLEPYLHHLPPTPDPWIRYFILGQVTEFL